MSERIKRFKRFHAALVEAQQSRDYMPMEFVGNDVAPYWNTYEMLTMLKCVNQVRESLDKPFVSWEDISVAERTASGHSDYTKKFALCCAELVDS